MICNSSSLYRISYQVPDNGLQCFDSILYLFRWSLNLDLILTLCKLNVNFWKFLGYFSDTSTLFSDHIAVQPSWCFDFCKNYTVCLYRKKLNEFLTCTFDKKSAYIFWFATAKTNSGVSYFRVNHGKSRSEFVLFASECDGLYAVLIGYLHRYSCCQ